MTAGVVDLVNFVASAKVGGLQQAQQGSGSLQPQQQTSSTTTITTNNQNQMLITSTQHQLLLHHQQHINNKLQHVSLFDHPLL